MNIPSWAQSSTNPEQIADTIKGAILGASVFIVWAANHFAGVTLGDAQIVTLAVQLGGAGAALWTIYGLVKKAFARASGVKA